MFASNSVNFDVFSIPWLITSSVFNALQEAKDKTDTATIKSAISKVVIFFIMLIPNQNKVSSATEIAISIEKNKKVFIF